MDTIKFILVIVLPQTQTFGWLIIASYASICVGAIFYMIYVFNHSRNIENTAENDKSKNILPQTTYQATSDQEEAPAVNV